GQAEFSPQTDGDTPETRALWVAAQQSAAETYLAAASSLPLPVLEKARHALAVHTLWQGCGDRARARTEEAAGGMRGALDGLRNLFAAEEDGGESADMAARHAAAARLLEAALVEERRLTALGPPLSELQAAGSEVLMALRVEQTALQEGSLQVQGLRVECQELHGALDLKLDGHLGELEHSLERAKGALEDARDEHDDCEHKCKRARRRCRDSPEEVARREQELSQARADLATAKQRMRTALTALMAHHQSFPELLLHMEQGMPDELVPLWDSVSTRDDFEPRLLQESPQGALSTRHLHPPLPDTSLQVRTRVAVYQGHQGGVTYAFKVFEVPEENPERLRMIWREASLLRRLQHPAIVPVLGLFFWQPADHGLQRVAMKLPFYEHGQLSSWVRGDAAPDDMALRLALLRVLEAVAHLHWSGIVHCDIKPENILVDSLGRSFLADFDISIDSESRTTMAVTHIEGTSGYLAPELGRGGACPAPATDMFAFGKTVEALLAMVDEEFRTAEVADLIQGLTAEDPGGRPSAAQACRHAYFTAAATWRMGESRACVIGACKGRWQLVEGLECSNRQGAPHFVCRECLSKHCDAEVDANKEQICCPVSKMVGECDSMPYTDTELAQGVSEAAFQRYFDVRIKRKEAQVVQEIDDQNKVWRTAELEKMRAQDEETRAVKAAQRHIEETLLNFFCPHCHRAIIDWDACSAVQHVPHRGAGHGCSGYFCGWCFQACNDRADAHRHAAQCPSIPQGVADPLFPSQDEYKRAHDRIKQQRVQEYLRGLQEKIRQKLQPKIAHHFDGPLL
ncbi:hypothetical protein CYMTET_24173, partial [Cymbomonas tetramitiformis]